MFYAVTIELVRTLY